MSILCISLRALKKLLKEVRKEDRVGEGKEEDSLLCSAPMRFRGKRRSQERERTSALSQGRGRCVTLKEEKNATAMQFVLLFSWQWHKERDRVGTREGERWIGRSLDGLLDVSDGGRTDERRRNSGEGRAESGMHLGKQRRQLKISPRLDLPYQLTMGSSVECLSVMGMRREGKGCSPAAPGLGTRIYLLCPFERDLSL